LTLPSYKVRDVRTFPNFATAWQLIWTAGNCRHHAKKIAPRGKNFWRTAGEKYLIVDQFCMLPKCKCTDAILDLVPAGEDAMKADPWCAFQLKYAKRHWSVMEDFPPPIPLEEIRNTIEAQHPDFYKQLLMRHEKLKKIYLNCRRKHSSPPQTSTGRKVGRNDPCPCGSGKKYKKCCLKSSTPIGFSDNQSDISGFQFPEDFKR